MRSVGKASVDVTAIVAPAPGPGLCGEPVDSTVSGAGTCRSEGNEWPEKRVEAERASVGEAECPAGVDHRASPGTDSVITCSD